MEFELQKRWRTIHCQFRWTAAGNLKTKKGDGKNSVFRILDFNLKSKSVFSIPSQVLELLIVTWNGEISAEISSDSKIEL